VRRAAYGLRVGPPGMCRRSPTASSPGQRRDQLIGTNSRVLPVDFGRNSQARPGTRDREGRQQRSAVGESLEPAGVRHPEPVRLRDVGTSGSEMHGILVQ
jgi:hypothetical protein